MSKRWRAKFRFRTTHPFKLAGRIIVPSMPELDFIEK